MEFFFSLNYIVIAVRMTFEHYYNGIYDILLLRRKTNIYNLILYGNTYNIQLLLYGS